MRAASLFPFLLYYASFETAVQSKVENAGSSFLSTYPTKAPLTKCIFWAVAKGSAINPNLRMLQPRSWNEPGRTTLQSAY